MKARDLRTFRRRMTIRTMVRHKRIFIVKLCMRMNNDALTAHGERNEVRIGRSRA